jgi:hypothetical protein
VQLSREAFFCALSVNMVRLCCFHNGEEASRFGILIGFGSFVGGIARLGSGKECCVVYDRNGSIDLQKTALEEVSKYSGYLYRARKKGAHRSARPCCVHSPKSKAVSSKVHTRASIPLPQAFVGEVEDTGFFRTWAGPWWSRRYSPADVPR